MGAYDGAEICEMVGLYLLDNLSKMQQLESVGLYRDDGLAVLRNCKGTKCECARKDLIKLFQYSGLKITTQTNLKKVDYLDVIMDLTNGRHTPYRKPNDTPMYINALSNHPKPVINQIPGAISKRLSTLSSDKDAFNTSVKKDSDALRKSGFTDDEIRFKKKGTPPQTRPGEKIENGRSYGSIHRSVGTLNLILGALF